MDSKRTQALLLLGIILGATVVFAATTFTSDQAGKVSDGVTFGSPSGTNITLYGDTNVSMENVFPDNHSAHFDNRSVMLNTSDGNITLASDNPVWASVHTSNLTGTWTNATEITAGSNWLEIYPADKQRVDTRGDVNQLSIRSITVDDSTTDFWYEGTDGGTVTVKIYNAPEDANISATDADTGEFLGSNNSNANGNLTLDLSASSHAVELNTVDPTQPNVSNPSPTGKIRTETPALSIDLTDGDFPNDQVTLEWYVDGSLANTTTASANGTYSAEVGPLSEGGHTWNVSATDSYEFSDDIADQSITVEHYTPQFSNAEPQGTVSSSPDELNVTVTDGDFPIDGDDVEVNITLDGSQVKSENIISNSSVSYGVSSLDLGDHTWNVSAKDSYGNLNTANYTFTLPSNLSVRNETNASQIITGETFIVTFYSDNGEIVVRRTDSDEDGRISLEGLPDTDFVVTVQSNNYYDRRTYIESIFEQNQIYVLNSTLYGESETVDTTFVYEDRTGNFEQSETTLEIQRAVDINGDDDFEWTTIAGDYWGAAGEFPFTGQYQARYLLVATNQETNTTRELGTHIPTSDGVKNIIVGNIIFDATNATGRYFDAGINEETNNLQILYVDPTENTSPLSIKVYEQGNKSNEIFNQTYTKVRRKEISVQLNESQTDQNWIVEFDGEHGTDGDIFGQLIVGSNSYPLPIDQEILTSLGLIFFTLIGSLYGPRTALGGAWALVGFASILMLFGWLQISVASVTVAAVIAAGATVYREGLPG